MQCVGFERFARRVVRDAVQHSRSEEIDSDGDDDHAEGCGACLNRVAVTREQKPRPAFPDHHARQDEQQRGLGERGDAFDLAVTVVVFLVGALNQAGRNW